MVLCGCMLYVVLGGFRWLYVVICGCMWFHSVFLWVFRIVAGIWE